MRVDPFPYLLLLFFISCSDPSQDKVQLENDITTRQVAVSKNLNDTTVTELFEISKVLEDNPYVDNKFRSYNNYLLGLYHRNNSEMDSCSYYFDKALEFSPDTLPLRSYKFIRYYNAAWDTHNLKSEYGDCLGVAKNYEQRVQPTDTFGLAWLNFFYAQTYFNNGEYDKAHQYNQDHLKYFRQLGDSNAVANAQILQININDYRRTNYEQSNAITQDLLSKEATLSPYLNLQILSKYAIAKYFEGDFETAKRYYEKSIVHMKNTADDADRIERLGVGYSNLAEVCLDLKDYETAEKYLDSVKGMGLNNLTYSSNRNYIKYQFRLAAETDKSPREIGILVDSISNFLATDYKEKYSSELVELTKAYEKEKELVAAQQQKEIENLRLETRLYLFAALALILIVTGLLFYRQRKLRFEKGELQMQQRLLRSQMNPHFTSNTLYAIQRQISQAPKTAEQYLLKFSRLLRLILENSMQNYVLLEDELDSLRKYMDLQLIRYPDKFDYTIEFEGIEEEDPVYIPPMLLQPFVENAIEHGFSGIDYKGNLNITLSDRKNYLYCSVKDNGKGLLDNQSKNKKSASTQLISDFLSKVTGKGVSIQTLPKTPTEPGGIIVSFLIPLKTHNDD